jgi:hypothetical protein
MQTSHSLAKFYKRWVACISVFVQAVSWHAFFLYLISHLGLVKGQYSFENETD